jgi:hypothetical protein
MAEDPIPTIKQVFGDVESDEPGGARDNGGLHFELPRRVA